MNEKKVDNQAGRKLISMAAAVALLGAAGGAAAIATPDRGGKQVVEAVCAECHAAGKEGAPKIGDRVDWSKRASAGLDKLTEHAIAGIRKMPAHGGQGSLTDLEISRAIAYMVSGGSAVDPSKPYSSPQNKNGEQLVHERCQDCHGTGKDGAPRIGDMEAWKPRLHDGVENLVKSAIRGHNAMPSRAGIASLSDADVRAAVVYMVNQGAANKAK
ncbi:MAG TPA: c-type cytochrome [Rhodocyclaceae bacterium]|nr:c-type cytochrome [Rhodocyclaceae bacterium]